MKEADEPDETKPIISDKPKQCSRVLLRCIFSRAFLFVRSLIALLGGLSVWTGGWNVLESFSWEPSVTREFCFVLIGAILMMVCNTFVAQAGLSPPRAFRYHADKGTWRWWVLDILLVYLRSFISLVGVIMMWSGGYTLVDTYFIAIEGVWKEITCFTVGIFLMMWTGCFLSEAGFDPYFISLQTPGEDKMSSLQTVSLHVRSAVAHFGSITYWVGAWNLLDAYILPYSLTRDVILMLTGIACLVLSNTLVTSAGVTFAKPQAPVAVPVPPLIGAFPSDSASSSSNHSKVRRVSSSSTPLPDNERENARLFTCETTSSCVMKYVRVFVSLLAGVLNWLGWWNFLCYDVTGEEADDTQQWGYFCIGLICLILTNTLFTNFGVITPLSLTPDKQTEIVLRQAEVERRLLRRNPASEAFEDDDDDQDADASSLWMEEM